MEHRVGEQFLTSHEAPNRPAETTPEQREKVQESPVAKSAFANIIQKTRDFFGTKGTLEGYSPEERALLGDGMARAAINANRYI